MGFQGVAGLEGQNGVAGPQGSQGLQGPQGLQGVTGSQGSLGFQGATGIGVQGEAGPQGDLGLQGPQGFQGVTGLGFQGPDGPTGATGIDGPQGFYGATGIQGPQGDQGFQGPQGLQGDTGIQGVTGAQGAQGPDSLVPGPIGPTGATGPIGETGPTGPAGPTGASGIGLPTGGATGQVLIKNSNTDYDFSWSSITSGSGGGLLQFGSTAGFPGAGSTSTLYVAQDTNEGWYWTGTQYKALGQYDTNLTVSLSGGKTFGKYTTGQVIPSAGKTPREVIMMAIAEALNPTAALSSSTTVPFNQTDINNVLNFSHTINTLGATVASATLQWRRNNTGSWTTLSTSTSSSGSYTHTLTDTAFNSQPFNYQYIVVDTAGATTTASLTITPIAYSAPTINLSVVAPNLQAGLETNLNREPGNVDTNLSGSISRVSLSSNLVTLISYTLQYSSDGGSTWISLPGATNVSISSTSATIATLLHSDTALQTSSTIRYRVLVIDTYTQSISSQTVSAVTIVTFSPVVFYGPSSSIPTNSTAVKSLPSKTLLNSLSNPFNLLSGTTHKTFTIAVPATSTVTGVVDLDALNASITVVQSGTPGSPLGSYIGTQFGVNNYLGTPSTYKVYTLVNASNYSTSHRHQISRT
jgi:hypothetical protein